MMKPDSCLIFEWSGIVKELQMSGDQQRSCQRIRGEKLLSALDLLDRDIGKIDRGALSRDGDFSGRAVHLKMPGATPFCRGLNLHLGINGDRAAHRRPRDDRSETLHGEDP